MSVSDKVADNASRTHTGVNCCVSSSRNCLSYRVDDLIKLCSDFYKKDEIVGARCIIDQFVPKRLKEARR
jgi:hypothetical protein